MATAAMLALSHGPLRAAAPAAGGDVMASAEKPQPGLTQYNGDWAVGCDNLLRCEAVALQPEGGDGEEPMLLQVGRTGGPAGPTTLRVSGLSRLPAVISLVVDGREVAVLDGTASDEAVVRGADALRVVQEMAQATTIELRPGSDGGKPSRKPLPTLASFSSAGLAESLRFIDSRQGRTGTQSAFVARGTEPDSAVPTPPVVPVVAQVPSPDADAAPSLTHMEIEEARRIARCEAQLPSEGAIELFPLDGNAALLLLTCDAGAYNVSAVPLIARGSAAGTRTFSVAHFDFAPGFTGEPGKPPLVVNALWDARRGVLSSLAKGRGTGDCGASENYVWDGAAFRLIESRAMHVCRGAWEWIRLWEAEPSRAEPQTVAHGGAGGAGIAPAAQ
ncbi:MAG: DUF1176 domain-containing protein [Sphingobium sp.]